MNYYKIFLKIMRDFDENYSYLKFKKYKPLTLIKKYKNDFKKINNLEKFSKILIKILKLFKDPHIRVNYKLNDGEIKSLGTFGENPPKNYNFNLLPKFLSKISFQNKIGLIGFYEKILYINIFSWASSKEREVNNLLNVFEKIIKTKNLKKIIIDVRSNGGGSDKFTGKFLSYFIPGKEKILVSKYLFRTNKKDSTKLGKEYRRYQESGKYFIDAKIVVLIGKNCMSSNEYLIMGFDILRKNKKIILIGDRTFGSSGNPKIFKYLNGNLEIKIPSWVCCTPEGKLFEGRGVKPDIFISSKKSIINNHDKVLEKAVNYFSSF
ncbi:MAG: S41 family peptidase [Nanoarchaeota archaeon]|nr:S41 family peptidase [Nanoarchaeota archaeon]